MSPQLHKRLPKSFVGEILESFNDHRISEEMAWEMLGVRRARFYKLRKSWLQSVIERSHFAPE